MNEEQLQEVIEAHGGELTDEQMAELLDGNLDPVAGDTDVDEPNHEPEEDQSTEKSNGQEPQALSRTLRMRRRRPAVKRLTRKRNRSLSQKTAGMRSLTRNWSRPVTRKKTPRPRRNSGRKLPSRRKNSLRQ